MPFSLQFTLCFSWFHSWPSLLTPYFWAPDKRKNLHELKWTPHVTTWHPRSTSRLVLGFLTRDITRQRPQCRIAWVENQTYFYRSFRAVPD